MPFELLNDPSPLLLVLGCALLCVIGPMLLFALQFLDIVFGILGAVVDAVGGVFGGGFEGCCGCIVLLVLLFGCGAGILILVTSLQTCGTPDAVNLCRFF